MVTGHDTDTTSKTQKIILAGDLFAEAEADTVYHLYYAKIAKLDYDENHLPKVRQGLAEMRADFPPEFIKECRRQYLLQQVQEAKESTDDTRIRRLTAELSAFLGKGGINDADIQKAREYPIRSLLGLKRGYLAPCPFHADKTASMDTRKNFYHCYACNESGDAIDLVMRMDNLSFVEAVRKLCAM